MDEDVKELTRLLANKIRPEKDSQVTIGWAVIITIFAAIIGFLTVGYMTNATNIVRLQSEVRTQNEIVKSIQESQKRIETTVTEIHVLQVRRYEQGK